MGFNNLRVKTKANLVEESLLEKNNEEGDLEPVSPGSEVYLIDGEQSIFILAMFESEIPIDVNAVCAFLKDDMISTSPRLSSIMIEDNNGKKMWKIVDVNVQDHVKIPSFPDGLSPERYQQYYDDYVSKISNEEVPLDKPLWECHIFKYPISHAIHGVIILKFHHALADGVSLMGALFSCFRRADDPSLPINFPSSRPRTQKQNGDDESSMVKIFSIVPKFISSIFYFFYDFGQGVSKIFIEDDQTPIKSGNHPHSIRISTVAFSLEDVKRIKTSLGVTVNDVVMGTIFLGIQLYMEEMNLGSKKGGSRKARSTAILPMNARNTKGYAHAQEVHNGYTKVPWGNKIAIFQLTLPSYKQDALANPLNFVMKPHKIFKKIRTSLGQHLLNRLFISAGPKVAAPLLHGIINNSSLIISNMIGPTEQISLAKHPIKTFYFMLVGMKMSIAVTVLSYMQKLQIGFGVEEDFIDQQKLLKCMENAFDVILQAAVDTPVS